MRGDYAERERNITRNASLCDGTPRRETGYRAHVMWDRRCDQCFLPKSILQVSPLFRTKREAMEWQGVLS